MCSSLLPQRDAAGDPNQAATVALCTQIIATCSQRLDVSARLPFPVPARPSVVVCFRITPAHD